MMPACCCKDTPDPGPWKAGVDDGAMSLSALWSGMTLAHFGYQALTRHDWEYAVEQSYAAGVVLLAVWAMMKIRGITFSRQEK